MGLRTVSYGAGVQSTGLLVLAAEGRIDFRTFLFSNVGEDSEHPATLEYFYEHAGPYAERHGINLHELQRKTRDGNVETLYGRLTRQGGRSQTIPVFLSSGAPGSRSCTADFKIRVIAKWLKANGATAADPATTALGISLDEFQRARTDSGIPHQRLVYPLIEMRLTRQDCVNLIRRAGLPVPPKSSCWFCPYHSMRTWQAMRHDEPELFWKAVALERHMSERRSDDAGKDAVWLSRKLVPLDQATSPHRQLPMFADEQDDACESGYCMV